MKVAHIFWGLGFGGVETMLVNIANEQTRLGAEVSVVIINDVVEPTLAGALDPAVRFVPIGRRVGSRSMNFLFRLNRWLGAIDPDVIHLHAGALKAFILRPGMSRRMCVTLHALPQGSLRRSGVLPRLSKVFNYGNHGNMTLLDRIPQVFAISAAVHDELLRIHGLQSTVIHNGIRTADFIASSGTYNRTRPLRIVQISRLDHEKKGQDLLVEAAAALPGVEVDFIGSGSSEQYLRRQIESYGLASRVRLCGSKSQSYVREHLRDYDLLVQPSRYEGFGLTVAEAMAACVPVIVSTGQGPAEVTCGERYGTTFDCGSAASLASAIESVMSGYSAASGKAREAMEYVRENYDISVTAAKYLSNYN